MRVPMALVTGSSACSMPAVTATAIVFVVDDDVSVRESLELLIADAGWRPELFGSAEEFLSRTPPDCPSCLVLDVSLPDLNGLELQRRIATERAELPIIFITGRGDIPMSVQAMKGGAVEFLTKPFTPSVLLSAIQGALERSSATRREDAGLQVLRDRLQSLSRREREVSGAGGSRQDEQTGRGSAGDQRDHRESPSRPDDAKDARPLAGGSREHRRATGARNGQTLT